MALTDTNQSRVAFLRGAGAVPATPTYLQLPFTSESLTANFTSEQSKVMRDDRQFASSRLVKGESGGDVGLEMAYGLWFDELLSGLLQVAPFPAAPASTDLDTIVNGLTKTFFAFEKRLEAESGYDYTIFQDCQIGSMTFDIKSNALANVSINVMGLEAVNSDSEVTGSTYTAFNLDDQMDTNSAQLVFTESDDTPINVTAQDASMTIDNQLRAQPGVGYFYSAGVASGRFKVTLSSTIYFRDKVLFNKFKANEGIKVRLRLQDSTGNYYEFKMDNVKVTDYDGSAGGADQDQVLKVELQAFPSGGAGTTLSVDRYTA